jgi:pimeloyl-ACP methyl ester carboxylesterase
MPRPVTEYAKSGDIHIAYQVTGAGPFDLVWIPGFVSHLEVTVNAPERVTERFSSFARLIRFDKRGTGMSDRVPVATLEERMDDVRAVMDAAGSRQAALFGQSEGGSMALLFAATYPERTRALVLYAAFAKRLWSPDYPIGVPTVDRQAYMDLIEKQWSVDADLSVVAPSLMANPDVRAQYAGYRRMMASPGAAMDLARMNAQIDVRRVLAAIHVPTLVLHRVYDRDVKVENGRFLAEHIPGARYVEFPEGDHLMITGDVDAIVDEVEEFLTGVRPRPEPDRLLATVLFTDIVRSSEHVAALGDKRWAEVKEAHHRAVRRELDRFRGREVDTAGDGFFVTFDGPARAIRCAVAIGQSVRPLGIEIRAGLHTGEVEIRSDGVTGLAVHIGARVMSLAGPGDILVSSTVKDLVAGANIHFDDRGTHTLKGIPGTWHVFAARC